MEFRTYYDDTDAGGVVYHANYLRYFERGRVEFFRERGVSVRELHDQGFIFAVVRLEIDYRAPAWLDDQLRVETEVLELGRSSFTLGQQVLRLTDGQLLAAGRGTLVWVGPQLKAKRLPEAILRTLREG